jgi:ATP-dependent Lon protease
LKNEHKTLPLLPLRGLLVYPSMVLHLDVGRDKSVQALEKVMMDDQKIFLSTQKEVEIETPEVNDIYEIGTLATVKQMLKLPNGTIRVLVEGLQRGKIVEFKDTEEFYEVEIEQIDESADMNVEEEALMRTVLDLFEQYIKVSKKVTAETFASVSDIEQPGRLADIIASHLSLKIRQKQEILETYSSHERLNKLIEILQKTLLILKRKLASE